MASKYALATFGAGCFWHVQDVFDQLKGVKETIVGYSGGTTVNPTYKEVCTDKTGHAEVVQIKFDPTRISYRELLELFFSKHDSTQLNQQGPDVGTQYRSVIFYHTSEQKKEAIAYINELETRGVFNNITTEIVEAKPFYKAEEYHQHYYEKTGTKVCGVRLY